MGIGTLLIRADASPQIGTGHVMRCLALAQAWQDANGSVAFACNTLPASLAQQLRTENIDVYEIEARDYSRDDAIETARIARNLSAEWIVVDGFEFCDEFFVKLSSAEIPLLLIDDHARRRCYEHTTLIVNPNIFAQPEMYQNHKWKALAGPKFALLRREFRSHSSRSSPADETFNLLLTLGGADPENVTALIVRALEQVDKDELEVTVLIGSANQHGDELRKGVSEAKYPIRFLKDVANVAEIMSSMRAAISAPGGSAAELAFLRVPMLLVVIADNHDHTAREFRDQGLASSLGWYNRLNSQQLTNLIQQFLDDEEGRSRQAIAAAARFDGLGPSRVLANLMRYEAAANI